MLDQSLARILIGRLSQTMPYNINIMDQNGMIIASRDESRINTFHELAFEIITRTKVQHSVDEDAARYLGVRPGVNMPIFFKGNVVGVVGVSGKPAEITPIANVIKMAIETMYEYEMYKDEISQRQSIRSAFMNSLLYEDSADLPNVLARARQLGINEKIIRLPVLFSLAGDGSKAQEFLDHLIQDNPRHDSQDLPMLTHDRQIVVFKAIETAMPKAFTSYRRVIGEYIGHIGQARIFDQQPAPVFETFIGSLQYDFAFYRYSYLHAVWLRNQAAESRALSHGGTEHYFYDYCDRYIRDQVPAKVYHNVFHALLPVLPAADREMILDTLQALVECDMNITNAARQLYVHRNTLQFRINKINEILDMNITSDPAARQLLRHLVHYSQTADVRPAGELK